MASNAEEVILNLEILSVPKLCFYTKLKVAEKVCIFHVRTFMEITSAWT